MSLPATSERALVLRIARSGESFHKIDIITQESGAFLCLKRISKKNLLDSKLDLFDTADVHLEPSKQGAARFIKEHQLVQRRNDIGKSYNTLCQASDFCALIAHNGPHMADPAILYKITERTLNAFAEKGAPEIIFLKALYLLLRDEGYPVRESWWPQLPTHQREPARQLINNPTPESATAELIETCTQINHNLRNWLGHETDLRLPPVQ